MLFLVQKRIKIRMKKCKHCRKRIWFWNKHIRSYHTKCVPFAYPEVKEYFVRIEYDPFTPNVKPVTRKQYTELKKDLEAFENYIQKKLHG